ncbi:MAG: S8 family serine peptidase, partial [Anaerolineae bacterium]|nr:S8 family serine peptidase [Anaerolineae bacterium]
AVADFLNLNGFDAHTWAISAPSIQTIYLPMVIRNGTNTSATVAPMAVSVDPIWSDYDLIIVTPETGFGSVWSTSVAWLAIESSGLPVAGMGSGGYALFGKGELPIGHPFGTYRSGNTVKVGDFGASQAIYSEPNLLTIPTDKQFQLYSNMHSTVNIALPDPLPDGIRVATITGTANDYPIIVHDDRYLLWGFNGLPGEMTAAGQDLFVNALYSLVSTMKLPVKGANFIPGAGYDQSFLDELGSGGVPLHAFVQLYHIPTPQERSDLASSGITLQTFLGETFYSVLVDPAFDPNNATVTSLVRWLGGTSPVVKVNPDLTAPLLHSANAPEITTILVTFHDDVSSAQALTVLETYTPDAAYYSHPIWEAPRTDPVINGLANEESVRWIDFGPPPGIDLNDTGRASTGAEAIQNAQVPATGAPTYLGLTGNGIVIAHFEDDADTTHVDISPRATIGAGTTGGSDSHATHVNGIMIGSGEDSINQTGTNYQWRGHAPEASTVSEGYGSGNADSHGDAILNDGAELSNHSYVLSTGEYDATVVAVDTIIRGDATTSGGDAVPAHLAIWAAANQGMSSQYNNEEGFYSIYSPAKNVLTVGSIDSSDGDLSMFSSRGPSFDGRIKPDVVAPGSVSYNAGTNTTTGIRSTEIGGGYVRKSGTSMAAPATTGVLALVLEQYHRDFGFGSTPLPATLKAILVNTADDLIHTASDGTDDNDRDLCRAEGAGGTPLDRSDPLDPDCWIPYGPGPDFATGYGAINAVNAVAAMRGGMWLENQLSPTDTEDTWTFTVPAGRDELRFTLVWDDEPGNSSAPNTTNQLVNDLDLRLIAPDSTVNFPFTLDPLPANANLGNGGLDPIDQADITDAFRGDDDRNNVEMVLVENPAAGTWTVEISIEGGFPTGNPQSYALVGDTRSLNIVEPQTGDVAEAGDPANPNVILVAVEAVNTLDGSKSTMGDADVSQFTVAIEGTPANIVSGVAVGDQFWLNVLPANGVYSAGSKYDLNVTWDGYGEDQENNSVLCTEREVTDRAIVIDSSGSMNSYDKMAAAQNAARLFIDQSLVGDRIAVVEFNSTASTPYAITEVSANPATPELN